MNYNGFVFEEPGSGYNKKYLKSKKGKKEIKKIIQRNKQHKEVLEERGFDDSELWNLDITIAAFILPRLKEFRKNPIGYPNDLTEKKWDKIIDKMIYSLSILVNDDTWLNLSIKKRNKQHKKFKEGLALFGKYLPDLWQ